MSDDTLSTTLSNSLRREQSLPKSECRVPKSIDPKPMDPNWKESIDSIQNSIKCILRPYTQSTQTNVQKIKEDVSSIYRIVTTAVVDTLRSVIMQDGISAANYVELPTFKDSNEEVNLSVSRNSTPAGSRISSSSSNRPDSSTSVKTNISEPHSESQGDSTSIYFGEDESNNSTITDNTSLVSQPHGVTDVVTEVWYTTYVCVVMLRITPQVFQCDISALFTEAK